MAGTQHVVVEILTNSQCACQPGSGWHAASVCQHVRLSDRVSSALQQSSRSRVSVSHAVGARMTALNTHVQFSYNLMWLLG
jgi:hypothetical protein